MTFVHPFALLLVALPLAYVVYEWPRTTRRTALCLKMLSFAAIFLAFSEPAARMPETKTGVVALVDTSDFHAGEAVRAAHAKIREHIPFMARDRAMDGDVKRICELLASGRLAPSAA